MLELNLGKKSANSSKYTLSHTRCVELTKNHNHYYTHNSHTHTRVGARARVGYSPGAREPGSHEIFRLTQNVGTNARIIINIYFPQQEMFCHRKKFLDTVRNFWPQEDFCKGRNF